MDVLFVIMSDILAFVGELKKEMLMVYGEAGSGKTTLALQLALSCVDGNKKVLYFDTEAGFSLERFRQMTGDKWAEKLDDIILVKIADFQEQYDKVASFVPLANKFRLIVVDTIGHHYRGEVRKDAQAANKVMDRQMRLLFEMSKHAPVILTNQVYSNVENNSITSVGGKMILKWCQKVIELQKKPRIIYARKPEEKQSLFNIVDNGLVFN